MLITGTSLPQGTAASPGFSSGPVEVDFHGIPGVPSASPRALQGDSPHNALSHRAHHAPPPPLAHPRRRQTLETTVVFEGCDVQATGYFKSLFKLLWFKASQQLSTAQPLTQSIHPAPVGWGGELEKGKVCELR